MSKLRVAVLRGGPSAEHDVSMRTGQSVIGALDASSRYVPVDVVVTRGGEWVIEGFTRKPQTFLETVDAVFIALHGAYGEDGEVQRILTRAGVPYTGSTSYPSALAMNKILTKDHLYDLPMKFAPHIRVTADQSTNLVRVSNRVEELLGSECVVKPIMGGSSLDTFITSGMRSLIDALEQLLSKYPDVLVEKRIRGREATCGVVERFRNKSLYALPVIEIALPSEDTFFDHEAKYSGVTEEICPARFPHETKRTVEDYARRIHRTLGLRQYSRSDFIVADDGVYFLEVNTLPGLTAESLLPKSLDAVGCTYPSFVEHLVEDARVSR